MEIQDALNYYREWLIQPHVYAYMHVCYSDNCSILIVRLNDYVLIATLVQNIQQTCSHIQHLYSSSWDVILERESYLCSSSELVSWRHFSSSAVGGGPL